MLKLKIRPQIKLKLNKESVSKLSNEDIISLWRATSNEFNFCCWLTKNEWVFKEGASEQAERLRQKANAKAV